MREYVRKKIPPNNPFMFIPQDYFWLDRSAEIENLTDTACWKNAWKHLRMHQNYFWGEKLAGLWATLGCSMPEDSAQNQIIISENLIRAK